MTNKRQSIADVENIFDYLLGIVSLTKGGENIDNVQGAFDLARIVLGAAEEPMRSLNMYEDTLYTFNEAERLVLNGDFNEAFMALQVTAGLLMDKSGTSLQVREVIGKFKL